MSRNTAKLKTHKEFELNLLDFAYSLLSFHFYLLYLLINYIVKPNGSSDDVISAALRKDNLNHEAEIQMLIAICEKHGIIIKRDEKTCEISIELSKEAPRSFAE